MDAHKLRNLLRLLLNTNYSNGYIANLSGLAPNTVKRYRKKLQSQPLTIQALDESDDNQLNSLFTTHKANAFQRRQPDWPYIHGLMQLRHQTLIQLWEEYRRANPKDAYCYSQFTHYYRNYIKSIDITMRQHYAPGEVAFVDFAGKRPSWTKLKFGKQQFAELFVGVLGHSQLIFAIAVLNQKMESWLYAHQQMLNYFGGVPQLIVPDNLKSAVTKPGKFPVINRSYQEMSEHYGFVIEPARVRRPQDKSLAEIGVLLVTRWITVVLRRRQFFSLEEMNVAIRELLEVLNNRPFKRYEGCRRSRFETQESETLMPLTAEPFDIGHWIHHQKVDRDYHVYVYGHAYSVPFEFAHQYVDIKVCPKKVEVYCHHKQVAIHVRSHVQGGATTENRHRPKSHRAYAEQSRESFLKWAEGVGSCTVSVVTAQFSEQADHSLKGCKACVQLQKLLGQYGANRLENACKCACEIQSLTASSVRSILQCNLDKTDTNEEVAQLSLPLHHNVRGANYYSGEGDGHE
ncbi:IS21 family transposase [Pseudoalteromonas viridis]|uniref:IS21 family transposase n=1 Tax=Pseudoalteromonas viridis TaxID=339617 RepID=A0ABX7V6N1_9GAMM|nr:IS21 family transposase [Pseudoalteromonas viridis]QTL36553.1 IS21 family transposase [Pseudoalteromonas viridis]